MAGPNKQFDHDNVLDKALTLFWEKGFEATSMQQLVDAMGINRASIYQTYGNKNKLFEASIIRYIENTLNYMRSLLELDDSPLTNLQNAFKGFIKQSLDGQLQGCLINNTAIELGPHDLTMAEKIRQVWVQFEKIFSDLLLKSIDRNELNKKTDVTQMASLLNTTLQGLLVKTKAGTSKKDLFSDIDTLFDLVRQVNRIH